jgi:hypothetical protein
MKTLTDIRFYRIVLVFGACIFLLALPMPTHKEPFTSSDGFASGLFSGMTYGYEAFLCSLFCIAFPPIGPLYAAAAIGGFMQVVLAIRTLFGKTPRKFWRWYFLVTGIAFPALMLFDLRCLKVGYFVFQCGYWITTIALWSIYKKSTARSNPDEYTPSFLRE